MPESAEVGKDVDLRGDRMRDLLVAKSETSSLSLEDDPEGEGIREAGKGIRASGGVSGTVMVFENCNEARSY